MNLFNTIRRAIIALTALFAIAGLTACDSQQVTDLKAENTRLTKMSSDITLHNKDLMAAAAKAEQALAAEQARASQLEKAVATEHNLRKKAEIRAAHLDDQVKGAKVVAGTAVDRSYTKGVEVGKAGGPATKTAKKAS